MKNKIFQKLKEKLEKEKKDLENQLKTFAKKHKKIKGEWETLYPRFDGGVGSQRLEEASDEVEAFALLLPLRESLEKQLKEVNLALEKIKKGQYGICEKCKRKISEKRLKAFPAARFCLKCKK